MTGPLSYWATLSAERPGLEVLGVQNAGTAAGGPDDEQSPSLRVGRHGAVALQVGHGAQDPLAPVLAGQVGEPRQVGEEPGHVLRAQGRLDLDHHDVPPVHGHDVELEVLAVSHSL